MSFATLTAVRQWVASQQPLPKQPKLRTLRCSYAPIEDRELIVAMRARRSFVFLRKKLRKMLQYAQICRQPPLWQGF
jgi:hypothetical protein